MPITILKRIPWVGEPSHSGLDKLNGAEWLAVDTETTGLDPWGTRGVDRVLWPSRPFFFSAATPGGETAWIRFPVNPLTREVSYTQEQARLLQAVLDGQKAITAHNAPFDRRMLLAAGFTLENNWSCTQIGMSVINSNEMTLELKPLCRKYFGIAVEDEKKLHESTISARRRAKLAGWPVSEDVEADYFLGDPSFLQEYGVKDSIRVVYLKKAQLEHMEANPASADVYGREMQLMRVLETMEVTGVAIDVKRNSELRKFYRSIAEEARTGIVRSGGGSLNPKSPKQMTAEFFGRRGHNPIRYSVNKKKGNAPVLCQHCKGDGCKICQDTGKNPKCDGEFLAHIGVKHEHDAEGQDKLVMGDPLAWHMLHLSASSTMLQFCDQYHDLMVHEPQTDSWVLKPNYKQTGARTARMSCERPNLQNVASDESGKKRVDVPYRSREVFIPRPGKLFYVPDYAQIEVWILALLSKDQNFIAALAAGGDAHQNVANLIWGHTYDMAAAKHDAKVDESKLTKAQRANVKRYKLARKRAKNLQFCKIYGGGAAKIASLIGCSVDEAKLFIAEYDDRLPAVKRFMQETSHAAMETGAVVNPFGRVYSVDAGYEYRATNYLIQGTAAEVAKNAMIKLGDLFDTCWPGMAQLLLQIHDEFLIEVDKAAHCDELMRQVVQAMSGDALAMGSPIPFPVGFKIAEERWSKAIDTDVKEAA